MENSRLKFRVWDKNIKAYITKEDLCIDLNGDLRVFVWDKENEVDENNGEMFWKIPENCIVEQCVGLKDKSGNLIYEGDRVIKFEEEGVVVYDNICGQFLFLGADGTESITSDELHAEGNKHIEIIGNIHEGGKK